MNELIRQLKGDEGTVAHAYQDHLGYWTIGVGRLIDKRKGGQLRPQEIEMLLQNDIDDRWQALHYELPFFHDLDEARQGVLINMAFQLGTDGLLGFHQTLKHVERGEYSLAADQMLTSKWAKQTPARAQRMAKQMRTGEWQYAPGA